MSPRRFELDIPFRTFLKVFVAALVAICAVRLAPMGILVLLAILIAVTLQPVRAFFMRWMPRSLATLCVSLGVILICGLVLGALLPAVVAQISEVVKDWPRIREQIFRVLPQDRMIQPLVREFLSRPGISLGRTLPQHLLTVGSLAIGGVSEFVILLTLSIYFLAEGKRTYDWILAFFEPGIRFKIHQTTREIASVISAYVAGQLITSVLVAIYAFVILSILHVPGALMLAVLAGVFDVLPIIGFFLSAVPAFLMAMTVSLNTALLVFGLYLLYHAIENYFIVPRVYGNRLRLSELTVLLSLLGGGLVAGIPGAILVLPIAASYPIVERIWLKRYLGPEVIEKHTAEDDRHKSA